MINRKAEKMNKIRTRIADIYALPDHVLRGYIWQIYDYCPVEKWKSQFLIELPIGKVADPLEDMASISIFLENYAEKLKEKLYFELLDWAEYEMGPIG